MPQYAVSDAEAYTVKCPLCKSAPGFTCTYMPKLLANNLWDPKSGQPTKRPHTERHAAFRKAEQRRRDNERRRLVLAHAKQMQLAWRNSIARSIRDGAMRDQAELIAWLKQHASILTGEEDEHVERSGADLVP